MTEVYLGLGSNLGDRAQYMRTALDLLLTSERLTLVAVSSLYETAPLEIADQPAFYNAVARVCTDLAPLSLLQQVKETERAVGRIARYRFGPREVDVDILLYGSILVSEPSLTIPHPRLTARAFALVPLLELAPEMIIPGTGTKVSTLIPEALILGQVTLIEGSDWYSRDLYT